MLPPLFNLSSILDAINQQALIITANQRLCSKAQEAWAQQQETIQLSQLEPPAIFSLSQWVDEQWFTLQTLGNTASFQNVASKDQQRILWERVTQNCGRMQTEKLAKQASTALTYLHQWQLSPDAIKKNTHFVSDAHNTFLDWCDSYSNLLKKNRLISQEEKINIIITAFKEQQLTKVKQCLLIGFDDLSPLLNTLFDNAIEGSIKKVSNTQTPKTLTRRNFPTVKDEINAAALWAKALLEKNPHARIGIISPELGQSRETIVNALTHTFEPQHHGIRSEQSILPFNISAGTPLGNTPLIADSLKLLGLLQRSFSFDDCCQWLYSPFWGKQSIDQAQRTRLANQLERLEQFEITTNQLRFFSQKITEGFADESAHSLYHYFRKAHELQNSFSFNAKPSAWVEHFLSFFDVLDWPGERSSDSMEYQQTQLWYQVLESFAGLDSVLGALTVREAIKELGILARSTPFQAKVPDSPIQVLGILEGAGLQFTHCWVMGLNQQAWPPAPAPNPLLPFALQKEHQFPHASATRELEFARSLTDQYRHCAEHIVMSYADFNESGDIHWQPSQLIVDIPKDDSLNPANTLKQSSQSPPLAVISCAQGPKITLKDDATVPLKGGSSVLKAMAENPFDAFARFRLAARSIDQPVSGFSSKEQGIIMHQALASIWHRLGSQQQLLEHSDESLNDLINNSVTKGVREQQIKRRSQLHDTLCQLEIDRQIALITDWLEIEKQRPAFTVLHIEESFTANIKGLSINIRIDRIDQLADGSLLIIDYKTGSTSLNVWKAQNPSDLQMPLYLLTQQSPVSGIAFAQINVKARALKGLHNGDCTVNNAKGFQAIGDNKLGLPPTWEDAKKHWEQSIEELLLRFANGDTPIELKNTNGFNQDLLPLNRFNELNRLQDYLKEDH